MNVSQMSGSTSNPNIWQFFMAVAVFNLVMVLGLSITKWIRVQIKHGRTALLKETLGFAVGRSATHNPPNSMCNVGRSSKAWCHLSEASSMKSLSNTRNLNQAITVPRDWRLHSRRHKYRCLSIKSDSAKASFGIMGHFMPDLELYILKSRQLGCFLVLGICLDRSHDGN